jgi:hypothetical protein
MGVRVRPVFVFVEDGFGSATLKEQVTEEVERRVGVQPTQGTHLTRHIAVCERFTADEAIAFLTWHRGLRPHDALTAADTEALHSVTGFMPGELLALLKFRTVRQCVEYYASAVDRHLLSLFRLYRLRAISEHLRQFHLELERVGSDLAAAFVRSVPAAVAGSWYPAMRIKLDLRFFMFCGDNHAIQPLSPLAVGALIHAFPERVTGRSH